MASQGSAAAYLFKFFEPRAPFILTLQEGDLGRNSPFDKFWQIRIIKKANAITAISGYLAEFAKKHNKKVPIFIVPNGAAISSKSEVKSDKKDKNQKIIITVSRLVKKNGIDILIKAVKELKVDDWGLQIIGEGPERKKLEKLAEKSGLAGKVRFLGNIPNEKVPSYLAAADVFVRPSRSEGLGSAFLEAFAAGVPIIGTAVGGIPDFLKEGETGLFCRLENPSDLAEKIDRILEDRGLSLKLAENGRKLVEEKYSWDKISGRVREIYHEVINHHSRI